MTLRKIFARCCEEETLSGILLTCLFHFICPFRNPFNFATVDLQHLRCNTSSATYLLQREKVQCSFLFGLLFQMPPKTRCAREVGLGKSSEIFSPFIFICHSLLISTHSRALFSGSFRASSERLFGLFSSFLAST